MNEINNRLKSLRKEKKMTQQKFAEILGISQNFLSSIENGDRGVPIDKLSSLSEIGANLDWLITGEGSMFKADLKDADRLVNIPDPSGDLAAAVRLLSEMPEEKRKDCLNYISDKKLLLDLQREIEKLKIG